MASPVLRKLDPRFQAVIFDLDGTLVDSAPDLCGVVNHMLAEHGRAALDLHAIRAMVGDGAAKLIERGFGATGGLPAPLPQLVARFIALYEGRVAQETRPFAGVVDTLRRLDQAGVRLGVCTNKPTGLTNRLLQELDLARFFGSVAGGDGPVRKPDPRHVQVVIEGLGAHAGSALMIGDSMNDVAAARAAGIPVFVVPFGYTQIPPAQLGADRVLKDFAELQELVGV